MKRSKFFSRIPFYLGAGALVMLFIKLPGVAFILNYLECTRCVEDSPFIAALGGAYFAALIAFAALFPFFPSRPLALLGLIWAAVLGIFFTFVFADTICFVCLIAHSLHVLMWLVWLAYPRNKTKKRVADPRRRVFATLLIGAGTFVLFWGINVGLEAYESHREEAFLSNVGQKAPPFFFTTVEGKAVSSKQLSSSNRYFLNFVLPKCGFCDEQMPQLDQIAEKYTARGDRFFNIVERSGDKGKDDIREKFSSKAPHMEIVIDQNQRLRNLFNISSFPTLIVLDGRGKIVKIIIGSSLAYDKEFEGILSHQSDQIPLVQKEKRKDVEN